jgi:hypothetical protein
MGYSGAGGKLIHEKNQKQKISRHCPFNVNYGMKLPMLHTMSILRHKVSSQPFPPIPRTLPFPIDINK